MWRRFLRLFRWSRWRPDGPLATNILQALEPRRVECIRSFRKKRAEIAERVAFEEGTAKSSGFLLRVHEAAVAQVETYAAFVEAEMLDTTTRVLGAVPKDAKDWMLDVFRKRVGSLANNLGDDMTAAEQRIGVASRSQGGLEAVVRIRAELLSLEIDRRVLANQQKRRRWLSALSRHPGVLLG